MTENKLTVRLFINNFHPNNKSSSNDFIECSSYSPQPLVAGEDLKFVFTDEADVFGFYVTDKNGKARITERFREAPYLLGEGSEIVLSVKVSKSDIDRIIATC